MFQILEELSTLVDSLGRGENEQSLISEYYKELTSLGHLIQSGNCPPAFNYKHESLFYEARLSSYEGRQVKEAKDHKEEFKKIFQERMRTRKYFAMDDSKMEEKHS
jgi:hypothetical protein